jgi:AraC-like DNA-binding protein/uncharacterized protein YjlB
MKRTSADFAFVAYATIRHSREWHYHYHLHPHHEVIAVEHGAMSVEMDGQQIRARAGDVLFYRAGHAHKEDADPRALATTLCLSYAGEKDADRIAAVTPDRFGRIRQMLHWIHDDMTLPEALRRARAESLVGAIVAELAYLAQPREHPIVERSRMYVREHLAHRITLNDLAAQAGTSKYHYLRSYQALTGVTPMFDVRLQRIEYARNLIVSTSWPMRVIAERVGFNNEFHLAKLFRKHLGIAPSSLRRG